MANTKSKNAEYRTATKAMFVRLLKILQPLNLYLKEAEAVDTLNRCYCSRSAEDMPSSISIFGRVHGYCVAATKAVLVRALNCKYAQIRPMLNLYF
jgi:hypothetical protein